MRVAASSLSITGRAVEASSSCWFILTGMIAFPTFWNASVTGFTLSSCFLVSLNCFSGKKFIALTKVPRMGISMIASYTVFTNLPITGTRSNHIFGRTHGVGAGVGGSVGGEGAGMVSTHFPPAAMQAVNGQLPAVYALHFLVLVRSAAHSLISAHF